MVCAGPRDIINGKEVKMAAYIKFDGIDGEAQDEGHKKWSDLESFSQVIRKPGSGTGSTRRRGDVICEDISLKKELDKSSPKLAEAVCKGRVFPKVEIDVTASYTNEGRVTYYRYELKNCQVVDYTVGGSGQAEEVPSEDISINFEEIKVTYTENDKDGKSKGNVEYSWKVEEGKT